MTKRKAKRKTSKRAKPRRSKPTAPEGRPTDYDPKYCNEIKEYFGPPYFTRKIIKSGKSFYQNGKKKYEHQEYQDVAESPRFVSEFARKIGVSKNTVYTWAKKHPEFNDAFKEALDMREEHLVTCGLKGLYHGSFSIFTAKNVLKWRDRIDQHHSASGGSDKTGFVVILRGRNKRKKDSRSRADG